MTNYFFRLTYTTVFLMGSAISSAHANNESIRHYRCTGISQDLRVEHFAKGNIANLYVNGKKHKTKALETGIFFNKQLGYRIFIDQYGTSLSISDMMLVCQPSTEIQTDEVIKPKQNSNQETKSAPQQVDVTGRSYGGKVRAGPGISFKQIGSLFYNDKLKILTDTNRQFNSYNWFKVKYRGKIGYQWGGLLCSDGLKLPDIYEQCPSQPHDIPKIERANQWFGFAKNNQKQWGLKLSSSKADAKAGALKNCGNQTCKINYVAKPKCIAITGGDTNIYIGAGKTKENALNFAYGFCNRSGQGCTLEYEVCQ